MNDLLMFVIQIFTQDICVLIIFNQISHIRLSKWIIAAVVLVTAISVLLPRVIFYLLVIGVLYFFGLKSMNILHEKSLAFFYSVYTISFFSFTGNLITTLVEEFLPNNTILEPVLIPFAVLLNWLVLRTIKPDILFLEINYEKITRLFLVVINTSLFVLCTLQYVSYSLEDKIGPLGALRYYLTISFLILFFISLFFLNMKINKLQAIQIQKMQEEEIKNLSAYSTQIEQLYDEVRSVRHDFINIMTSLKYSLDSGDISKIKKVYKSVFMDLKNSIDNDIYELGNLSKIHVEAIKSVLAAKVIEAQHAGITVAVELQDDINQIYISNLDYIRLLTILFDNAIEAANETSEPMIQIAIILDQETRQQFLIVRNSIKNNNIDKKNIYVSGYSTKGVNRGQGLAIVNEILAKNMNVNIETEVKDFYFTQKITFEKWT